MTNHHTPLRFSSEVEAAVRFSGIPDMDLAHGAGLIADADRFRLITATPQEQKLELPVYGVTAITLNGRAEMSFRTATFGIDDPQLINQVDSMGTTKIIDASVPTDKIHRTRAVLNSKIALYGLFSIVADGPYCTLGGAVTTFYEVEQQLRTSTFISEKFARYLDARSASKASKVVKGMAKILSPRVREQARLQREAQYNSIEATTADSFVLFTAAAVKRPGGPVVVEQPFKAKI